MAKKKSQGPSKSQAVRDYLTGNPSATASVVIPELAQRGINVSVALVSQVKKRMKQAGQLDGQNLEGQKAATKKSAAKKAAPKKSAKTLTADDLVEAKKLVDELGGMDQARQALEYLEELG